MNHKYKPGCLFKCTCNHCNNDLIYKVIYTNEDNTLVRAHLFNKTGSVTMPFKPEHIQIYNET